MQTNDGSRYRATRYFDDGRVLSVDMGVWTEYEMASIRQLWQKSGWNVAVEFIEPSDWPSILYDDILDAEFLT